MECQRGEKVVNGSEISEFFSGQIFLTRHERLGISCFFHLFLGCAGSIAACRLSLVAVSRGHSSLQCADFSLR